MPSKKRSNTSRKVKPPKYRYFTDRNLGSFIFPSQLREAGIDVVVHDDIYAPTERDPKIFYDCGIKGLVVVTTDMGFRKSFPHMAAISFAGTSVITFTNNKFKADVRGTAFIQALPAIERAMTKYKGKNFIGVVGTTGTFRVCEESPLPSRKTCDERDWESFESVCRDAGKLHLIPPR